MIARTDTRSTFSARSLFAICALIVLGLGGLVSAQVSHGGTPWSIAAQDKTSIQTEVMPAIDLNRLQLEDRIDAAEGKAFRFGEAFSVNLSMENTGTWTDLPDGSRVWRLRISCPGAYSINLIYSAFHLPAGTQFYVYSEDQKMILGSFTEENNKPHGQFATAPVKGDSCILEYDEPAGTPRKAQIQLGNVIHGYKNVFFKFEKDYGESGSCNINVACTDGDNHRDQIRSAGMLLTTTGTRFCSGSLINNTRQDKTPLFLTANHCTSSTTDYNTWVVMFNYQSATCANADGPTTQTCSGAALKAKNADSDFCLIQLNEAPPTSYNVYYSGWNRVNTAATSAVCIHHPNCDIKKISFYNTAVASSDYEPSAYLADSHWKIANWSKGTTEPGSSGSPLFDQNKRIVGQLHGGWAACNDARADFFGKLSMSWDRGTTNTTRLKDWLDPTNSGVNNLDGLDGNVAAPSMSMTSETLGGGDGDAYMVPGESLEVRMNLKNAGSAIAKTVSAALTVDNGVTVTNSPIAIGDLAAGASVDKAFAITLPATIACGQKVHFALTINYATSAGQALTYNNGFDHFVGVPESGETMNNDVESGTAGWTTLKPSGTTDWAISTAQAHSATHSWFDASDAAVKDNSLVSPAFVVPAGGVLTFWHRYDLESNYDGGVLEILPQGSTTWTDLGSAATVNGYTSTISSSYSNPLAGRRAWSGTLSTFTQVSVPLTTYVGQSVQIRFRQGCDTSTAKTGWYVDDIVVAGSSYTCPGGDPTGDVNNDGDVDSTDLSIMLNVTAGNLTPGTAPCTKPAMGDFNHSGAIDSQDVAVLLAKLCGM